MSGGFRAGNKLREFLARQEGKPTFTLNEARQAFQKNKTAVLKVLDEASRASFAKNAQELYAKTTRKKGN